MLPLLPSNSLYDADSDEMLTLFEATFNDSHVMRKFSPRAKSLQQMVQSAGQGCHSSYSVGCFQRLFQYEMCEALIQ